MGSSGVVSVLCGLRVTPASVGGVTGVGRYPGYRAPAFRLEREAGKTEAHAVRGLLGLVPEVGLEPTRF